MRIERKHGSIYKNHYVFVNGKEYKLENIIFYEDGKILTKTGNGWLESKNERTIDGFEIPVEEIKLRRKENFDGTVFIISKGKEDYDIDTIANLYIPAEMLNIHFVEYRIEYHKWVRAIYDGEQNIRIIEFVKSIDTNLSSMRTEFDNILKRISGYHLEYKTETITESINELKELAERYIVEKERVENLTIGDIEI